MDQHADRLDRDTRIERIQTVVIGGGQAGLSVGYHLSRRGLPFVILDANERVGDAWRGRWESLRLFSPARYDGLDGMPFPASPHYFPTKDEMADYLEAYAAHFDLPVRNGARVERVSRNEAGYLVEAGGHRFEADNVVVAMGTFQRPKVPSFAERLDPAIVQVTAGDYQRPDQLRDGEVLLVGAGNSASEIAMDLVRRPAAQHPRIWMAGRDTGHIPFRIDKTFARLVGVRFVLGLLFPHVITVDNPVGRKARPKVLSHGGPLIRVKPKDLARAGIERVGRVEGVRDGRPVLDDGRVLDVANVVWCTGFEPGFASWLDLPVHGDLEPAHDRGVVPDQPGLYFVGLLFQHSLASEMIQGVGRDAARVVDHLAARTAADGQSTNPPPWNRSEGAFGSAGSDAARTSSA